MHADGVARPVDMRSLLVVFGAHARAGLPGVRRVVRQFKEPAGKSQQPGIARGESGIELFRRDLVHAVRLRPSPLCVQVQQISINELTDTSCHESQDYPTKDRSRTLLSAQTILT